VVLACDLIVAARDASRWSSRSPATRCPLPAADTYRLGLVNALTEAGQALDGARRLAARFAVNGPLAVAATRQIVAQQHDWDMADVWANQEPIMRPAFQSEDAREAALAFTEKRSRLERALNRAGAAGAGDRSRSVRVPCTSSR
jgi:hypothetical protein